MFLGSAWHQVRRLTASDGEWARRSRAWERERSDLLARIERRQAPPQPPLPPTKHQQRHIAVAAAAAASSQQASSFDDTAGSGAGFSERRGGAYEKENWA